MKFHFEFKQHNNDDRFGYEVEFDQWPTVKDFMKILNRLKSDMPIDSVNIWRIVEASKKSAR